MVCWDGARHGQACLRMVFRLLGWLDGPVRLFENAISFAGMSCRLVSSQQAKYHSQRRRPGQRVIPANGIPFSNCARTARLDSNCASGDSRPPRLCSWRQLPAQTVPLATASARKQPIVVAKGTVCPRAPLRLSPKAKGAIPQPLPKAQPRPRIPPQAQPVPA